MPAGTAAPETALRPIAQVAVEARVGSQTGLFDYAVPEALRGLIEVGHRVRVPFGKRTVTGFVYALDEGPTVLELKPIEALLDAEPVLPSPLVELAGFVAAHYLVPLDEVIRAIVPPRVRAVVRRARRDRARTGAGGHPGADRHRPFAPRVRRFPPARRHGQRQDRGLPGPARAGAGRWGPGPGAGARDRAHAADRRALRGTLPRTARRPAQRADRSGAGRRVVADPARREI